MNGARLTTETLREMLDYCPETGVFSWKVNIKRKPLGSVAGSIQPNGYLRIQIKSEQFMAHRLAWFYVHGVWPDLNLDHINGIKTDNRIANLREATLNENMSNIGRRKHNKSGLKGVSFCSQTGKWRAGIQIAGVEKNLGRYPTKEEASAAYRAAAIRGHGAFANFDLGEPNA